MVSMSMSSSLSPMSGANLPPIVAWEVQATSGSLNFSKSNLAFSPSSDELDRSSSPGHGHFLCLLQENALSYGCEVLIGSAFSPKLW